METLRTKDFNPDYKSPYNNRVDRVTQGIRNPCCLCFRQIKTPPAKTHHVHVMDAGMKILHPGDEEKYKPDGGDIGFLPIGSDCARKVGMEWVHKP